MLMTYSSSYSSFDVYSNVVYARVLCRLLTADIDMSTFVVSRIPI